MSAQQQLDLVLVQRARTSAPARHYCRARRPVTTGDGASRRAGKARSRTPGRTGATCTPVNRRRSPRSVAVGVDGEHLPVAEGIGVRAERRLVGSGAEVAEVAGGTRLAVVVVARHRSHPVVEAPPGGFVAALVLLQRRDLALRPHHRSRQGDRAARPRGRPGAGFHRLPGARAPFMSPTATRLAVTAPAGEVVWTAPNVRSSRAMAPPNAARESAAPPNFPTDVEGNTPSCCCHHQKPPPRPCAPPRRSNPQHGCRRLSLRA